MITNRALLDINLRHLHIQADDSDDDVEGGADATQLLEDVAEGLESYSGADITNLCRDASMMAMRRAIGGKPLEELKRLRREEIDKPITREDFVEAAARSRKTCSDMQCRRYEEWMEQHGSF